MDGICSAVVILSSGYAKSPEIITSDSLSLLDLPLRGIYTISFWILSIKFSTKCRYRWTSFLNIHSMWLHKVTNHIRIF